MTVKHEDETVEISRAEINAAAAVILLTPRQKEQTDSLNTEQIQITKQAKEKHLLADTTSIRSKEHAEALSLQIKSALVSRILHSNSFFVFRSGTYLQELVVTPLAGWHPSNGVTETINLQEINSEKRFLLEQIPAVLWEIYGEESGYENPFTLAKELLDLENTISPNDYFIEDDLVVPDYSEDYFQALLSLED